MSTHALTSHHLAEVSAIETDGLWCIGVGALVVALSALVGGHLGGIASRPFTALGLRKDRLMYAGTVAGGVLVASGSLIVAGEHVPAVWMVIATAVWVVGAFWLLAAWRLRVGSTEDGKNLTRDLHQYPTQAPGLRWDIQKAELQMQWRWALRHAFSSDASNSADAERRLGRRPKTKDADQESGEEEPSQEPGEKDPSQLPGEDDASRQLIWEEYQHRHDLCWRLIVQATIAAILIYIVPYVERDVAAKLEYFMVALPLIGIALVVFALRRFRSEEEHLERVRTRHWSTKGAEHSSFRRDAQAFLRTLILLGVVNIAVIVIVWVPRLQ